MRADDGPLSAHPKVREHEELVLSELEGHAKALAAPLNADGAHADKDVEPPLSTGDDQRVEDVNRDAIAPFERFRQDWLCPSAAGFAPPKRNSGGELAQSAVRSTTESDDA